MALEDGGSRDYRGDSGPRGRPSVGLAGPLAPGAARSPAWSLGRGTGGAGLARWTKECSRISLVEIGPRGPKNPRGPLVHPCNQGGRHESIFAMRLRIARRAQEPRGLPGPPWGLVSAS